MINGRKVIISIFVVMVVMCFCVGCSYSQEKPSEEVMKSLIFELVKLRSDKPNIKIIKFKINNTFVSKKNGRYCIDVDLNVSNVQWGPMGPEKRFSFEKKGNQWFSWVGWGPGE